ncbi:MAG: hypothetical protein GY785_05660 [Gammaproteobacteria bacterium]|nr:hypothetical protein [Gammaproteobacteria bacterium]
MNHAVNGQAIAEICSDGLDFATVADYARGVGGPALRRHSFHQRALMRTESPLSSSTITLFFQRSSIWS